MKYFKQLDGLRFYAVFAVMIHHWASPKIANVYFVRLPFGSGVDLFFLLSGFLITKIILDFRLYNEKKKLSQLYSIKEFYLRRTLRIFPIYYLTVLFLAIINYGNTRELFYWLISYTANIKMAIENDFLWPFTHFWSLSVEEQFYVFWVFIIAFIPRKRLLITILGFIIVSIGLRYYLLLFTSNWLAALALVFTNMHTLGLGALLAYFFVFKPDSFFKMSMKKVKILTFILFLVYVVLYVWLISNDHFVIYNHYRNPLIAVLYALILFIAIRSGFRGIFRFMLENKIIIFLGRISYGLYVYHIFAYLIWQEINKNHFNLNPGVWERFVILLFICVLMATLSWYIIERPINSLKKYFPYIKNK